MTKTYRARLSLEATVPEDTTIEPFLKASVEFEIYCPKCEPFRHSLKKKMALIRIIQPHPNYFIVNDIRFTFTHIPRGFSPSCPRLYLSELFRIFLRRS